MPRFGYIVLLHAAVLLPGLSCATTKEPISFRSAAELPYPPAAPAGQPLDYEVPPALFVLDVMEPGEEIGPHHHVSETVTNDGFMHHITVHSESGAEYPAYGVERARVRIHEIEVTAELAAMKKREARGKGFGAGLKSTALGPFRQLKKILRNPLYAVAVVPGAIFKYAGLAAGAVGALRHGVGKEEIKEFIGYYDARKDLAERLGVDPHTTNADLRQALDETAWAFYSGGLPIKLIEDFMPGIPKLSTGFGSTSVASAIDKVRPSSRKRALKRLLPNKDQRKAFLAHEWYTPETERRLLNALRPVRGAEDAGGFILAAMDAASEDQAYAFMRSAELLEAYCERVGVPGQVLMAGPFPIVRQVDGPRTLLLYADHVSWTQEFAGLLRDVLDADETSLEAVWISGTFSSWARGELEERGLEVVERAFENEAP